MVPTLLGRCLQKVWTIVYILTPGHSMAWDELQVRKKKKKKEQYGVGPRSLHAWTILLTFYFGL